MALRPLHIVAFPFSFAEQEKGFLAASGIMVPILWAGMGIEAPASPFEQGIASWGADFRSCGRGDIFLGDFGLHWQGACSKPCFPLLCSPPQGVFLSRLMSDFAWLTEEILLRQRDVAFSGQLWALVLHSLTLLRGCVSLHQLSLGDVLVAPQATEPVMRQLSLHGAALLPIFMAEAVGGKWSGWGDQGGSPVYQGLWSGCKGVSSSLYARGWRQN